MDQIEQLNALSAVVLAKHGVTDTYDVADQICDRTTCNVVDDGVLVYRDFNHLSSQWTRAQVPQLSAWMSTLA